jgi:DNA-binding NarL/FixJ family response regulator
VVAAAPDGQAAVRLAAALAPDVVVMDICMPGVDGVEATRRLVRDALLPTCRVVILTTFDEDDYVVEALRAGASGFLLKDLDPDDLVEAIRVVAAGGALLAPSVTRSLLDRFAERLPAPTQEASSRVANLSKREIEILALLARGLSNQELADRLVVTLPTVKSHVSHLLDKLDIRDRTQAAILAYEAGIVRPHALDAA